MIEKIILVIEYANVLALIYTVETIWSFLHEILIKLQGTCYMYKYSCIY